MKHGMTCKSACGYILKHRKVTAMCSITPTDGVPVLYFPSYSAFPLFSCSGELARPDPFYPTIVWFLSRNCFCLVVCYPMLSSFGETAHPQIIMSALLLETPERRPSACPDDTEVFKIILESILNLPRRITSAKKTGRSTQLDGAVTY